MRLLLVSILILVLAASPMFTSSHGTASVSHRGVPLRLSWAADMLSIHGSQIPGGELKVRYLEAYCRPGSTDRDWGDTIIRHKTELVGTGSTGSKLTLRSALEDGVVVEHLIQGGIDEVDFQVTATNPTRIPSDAHWVQPCIRVASFTGVKEERNSEAYLPQCFIFVANRLTRMPVRPWATRARYIPGQVWCPKGVSRNDVNPRPLSALVPSNGLIGCFSADEKMIMATAWQPYQELFQGIIVCLHSDFRIGGLLPGQTKQIRGKIYIVEADVSALLRRYKKDFPKHVEGAR